MSFTSDLTRYKRCAFKCGEHNLLITDRYTYLGITLNDFLEFNVTAKAVAQSEGRALCLLIAKLKCMGGCYMTCSPDCIIQWCDL